MDGKYAHESGESSELEADATGGASKALELQLAEDAFGKGEETGPMYGEYWVACDSEEDGRGKGTETCSS